MAIYYIDGFKTANNRHVLFADAKTDVPSTGVATAAVVSGVPNAYIPVLTLAPGSVVYTSKGEVAALTTADTWNWWGD